MDTNRDSKVEAADDRAEGLKGVLGSPTSNSKTELVLSSSEESLPYEWSSPHVKNGKSSGPRTQAPKTTDTAKGSSSDQSRSSGVTPVDPGVVGVKWDTNTDPSQAAGNSSTSTRALSISSEKALITPESTSEDSSELLINTDSSSSMSDSNGSPPLVQVSEIKEVRLPKASTSGKSSHTTARQCVSRIERGGNSIVITNYYGQGTSGMQEVKNPVKVISANIVTSGRAQQAPATARSSAGNSSSRAICTFSTTAQESKSVSERAGYVPPAIARSSAGNSSSRATYTFSTTAPESKSVSERAGYVPAVNVPLVAKYQPISVSRPTNAGTSDEDSDGQMVSNNPIILEQTTSIPRSAQPSSSGAPGGETVVRRETAFTITVTPNQQLDREELCGRFLTRPCPSLQGHSRAIARACCVGSVIAIAVVGALIFFSPMGKK